MWLHVAGQFDGHKLRARRVQRDGYHLIKAVSIGVGKTRADQHSAVADDINPICWNIISNGFGTFFLTWGSEIVL